MDSWSPLVIGRSCGSVTSRPFAFAFACPRSREVVDLVVHEVVEAAQVALVDVETGGLAKETFESGDADELHPRSSCVLGRPSLAPAARRDIPDTRDVPTAGRDRPSPSTSNASANALPQVRPSFPALVGDDQPPSRPRVIVRFNV